MKKVLLAFAIATATLATLGSCTKEYITNNNYLPGVTYIATLNSNTWSPIATGSNIYSTEIPFPELDKQYYDFGTVQIALEFPSDPGYYNSIPATIKNIHYSFDYTVGYVTVFAEVLTNGDKNLFLTKNIKAKVTLTDADRGDN